MPVNISKVFKSGLIEKSERKTMSSNHSEYYICKEDKDVVITFNASGIFIENSFRKKSKIIFKDCPALLKKILDKTWKMKNIPEIVEYYNNQCTYIEE